MTLTPKTVTLMVKSAPPPPDYAAWTFYAEGSFPQHLPDDFTGAVILDALVDVPIEVHQVWDSDYSHYWFPGFPSTLNMLVAGETYNVTVSGACEWLIPLPEPSLYIPIEVVSLDANHNGIVDAGDEAMFLAALGSTEGDASYERQFDANFDGIINEKDEAIFYQTEGKALDSIRNSLKTNIIDHLVWPDGWDAYIVALEIDKVNEFTGRGVNLAGWISVQLHPYVTGYVCGKFSRDTAVAAYKALGYGCLLPAFGTNTGVGHFYNVFWTGGDWHDLSNWQILEPQSGRLYGLSAADPSLPTQYHTFSITFYDGLRVSPITGATYMYSHILRVDYINGTVSFMSGESSLDPVGAEEPVPDTFDRSLGVA